MLSAAIKTQNSQNMNQTWQIQSRETIHIELLNITKVLKSSDQIELMSKDENFLHGHSIWSVIGPPIRSENCILNWSGKISDDGRAVVK